jgi:hypothetical protein
MDQCRKISVISPPLNYTRADGVHSEPSTMDSVVIGRSLKRIHEILEVFGWQWRESDILYITCDSVYCMIIYCDLQSLMALRALKTRRQ